MLIYGTTVVAALVIATIVYRYDLYDREPWWLLLLTAGLGAGAMWVTGHVEDWTRARLPSQWDEAAASGMIAATHEEAAKFLVVLAVALVFRRQFNDPMDGLIYGAFAGLGMAVEESLHFTRLNGVTGMLPQSELPRLLGHLVFGGIGGFGLGPARFGMRGWPTVMGLCLLAAVGLHATWNLYCATPPGESVALERALRAIGLMLTGLVLFWVLVAVGGRWSQAIFLPRRRLELQETE
jgi:RsiW-degrading membrane proteinase PrsW (M82 family)